MLLESCQVRWSSLLLPPSPSAVSLPAFFLPNGQDFSFIPSFHEVSPEPASLLLYSAVISFSKRGRVLCLHFVYIQFLLCCFLVAVAPQMYASQVPFFLHVSASVWLHPYFSFPMATLSFPGECSVEFDAVVMPKHVRAGIG